jgi:hypothetical protein
MHAAVAGRAWNINGVRLAGTGGLAIGVRLRRNDLGKQEMFPT